MKTTQECWQALIDGEALNYGKSIVRLNQNGMLVNNEGLVVSWGFSIPQDWSIYTPPKWYDNIPEGGVLCWCWDGHIEGKELAIIGRYFLGDVYPFKAYHGSYENAEPLTKQEIQQLLDNAPEGEGE